MDGILIIDKPAGMTSHDVVARVRRILRERRVGHTGTLDPFATGVLVILVGRATRLAQFLSNAVKEYEATIRFGYATDTGDMTGTRLVPAAAPDEAPEIGVSAWGESDIEAALAHFRGEIEQVPPMYSAKKIQGQKLYELARRGLKVERAAVPVTIHELQAVRRDGGEFVHDNEDGTREMLVRVLCSAGTYIRTLAETIGERLGTPAHLCSLRRTRAGDFRIEKAISLEDLETEVEEDGGATRFLVSMDAALPGLPFLHLTADEAQRALHGMALRTEMVEKADWQNDRPVRMLLPDGQLIAVGFYDEATGSLRPRVVFSPEK
jgi:tRNA pseudouridine55 synthase